MKTDEKKILFVYFHLFLSATTIVALNSYSTLATVSKIGATAIGLMLIINFIHASRFIYPFMLILVCFVLFQFGIPILYAINQNYSNWYIGRFKDENIVYCVRFSTYCIMAFNFGGGLVFSKPKSLMKCRFNVTFSDDKTVIEVAKCLVILTGLIVVPLTLYVTSLSMQYGYSYVKEDRMSIYNGLTNAARTFFIPALLLWLAFEKSKKSRQKIVLSLLLYSLMSMASGGRTEGLPLLLTLLYYYQQNTDDTHKNRRLMKNTLFAVGVLVILYLLRFVANTRSNSGESIDFFLIPESLLSEMGFNFTSVCFTRELITSTEGLRYGKSYLHSLLCLYPKSLDPTGTIAAIEQFLPENWLAARLAANYGSLYGFGVGYSVIAECYLNFGDFGWVAAFVQGMLVQKVMGSGYRESSNFKRYAQLVMLWALITYPRRSFSTLLKTLEYCIVAIIVLVWFSREIKRSKGVQSLNPR